MIGAFHHLPRVIMLLFCICSTALTAVMAEWLSCCPTVYCSAVRARAKFAARLLIGLPANLFYGTGIPACILVFRKDRISRGVDNVLFIDASAEGNFEKGKNQNLLRDTDIQKIVDAYKKRETMPKYSYRATLDEIRENDYNLNIPRYVDTFEEEAPVDIQAVKKNIADIEAELAQVQEQMKKYLDELGL